MLYCQNVNTLVIQLKKRSYLKLYQIEHKMGIELAINANKLKTERPREWIMTVQTNMTSQINEPNKFDLCGIGHKHKDILISYSTTSIAGKPIFNYKDSEGTHNFTGDEIRTLKTEIGTMITVTLKLTVDTGNTTLTVLVPNFKLQGSAQEFKTIAIKSINRTSFLPITGALESYEVICLQGTADSVLF